MNRIAFLPAVLLLYVHSLMAQSVEKLPGDLYGVYSGTGQARTLDDLFQTLPEADVVLLGEQHDDSLAHRLQYEILAGVYERNGTQRPVVLSLEAFERDVQLVVDEYLEGLITEQHFLSSSRPWPNYTTDYRPMVEFAKTHQVPVVAANAPRRYTNRVTRNGPASLDDLSKEARRYLAPLPYAGPSPAYQEKWGKLMQGMETSHTGGKSADSARAANQAPPIAQGGSASVPSNMLLAQSLWDATMAHSIAQALKAHKKALVVHVVGGFHIEGGSGLPEQLARYRKGVRVVTVLFRPSDDVARFVPESMNDLADFVILTGNKSSISVN